jgi:diguanylate cyclase (GGDEF)-like protein
VLESVAAVARRTLRGADMMARIGGEEFGVILWDATPADAARICERLRSAIGDTGRAIASASRSG